MGDVRPELIFALVGPAGVRLEALSEVLTAYLAEFGYKTSEIRLSVLLEKFKGFEKVAQGGEYERIKHHQKMGAAFRAALKNGSALALAGIAAIRQQRAAITGSADKPADAQAYVLNQLKHPAEVDLLRRVYGDSFILLAGHAPKRVRVDDLAARMANKENRAGQVEEFRAKADDVIKIDEKEPDDLGQNTRDTYPMADFFCDLEPAGGANDLKRVIDLLFGHPFRTPNPKEYAMYQASALSLRSSDHGRQVGAVIVSSETEKSRNVDVIASGMNEVPKGGGGFYWDKESPDARDQYLKREYDEDRAADIKKSVLTELIERMQQKKWLREDLKDSSANLAAALLPDLRQTQFQDIGEFGRPVHAEMAALIDGARRGVAVNGQTMYVTTFPCHNCAKHIIAAGLRRVVYLEPYPKSRADYLHKEEISLDVEDATGRTVVFNAFTGIAPRQYQRLFAMSERGAKRGMILREWEAKRSTLKPRYVLANAASAYIRTEAERLVALTPDVYQA